MTFFKGKKVLSVLLILLVVSTMFSSAPFTASAGTAKTAPTIKSIIPVCVTTPVGTLPVLPTIVTAVMSSGSMKKVSVKWNSIASSSYATSGTFTVRGKASNITATANVIVNDSSSGSAGSTDYSADTDVAYNVVKEISDLKYKGRKPGTKEYKSSVQYVAGVFQQMGLTPDGDSGSFLQAYKTGVAQFSAEPTLTINGKSMKLMTDFKPHGNSESGTLSGSQIIYVGNGYSSDYSGLDVSGKIVAFTNEMTGTGTPTGTIDRAEYAVSKGAIGALIISGKIYSISNYERPLNYIDSKVFADYISPQVAASMGINLSEKAPQTVNAQVQGNISITRTPNQTSYNVLGLIKGQDTTRTIMIEANLDSYGTLPDGTVFPGASADAAGVGDLAGLAEYYRSLGTKPACNILLAAVGSECYDRSGIEWFLAHKGKVGKIVADVNLYDVGGKETQKSITVNSCYEQLDAAARFSVKLDANYDSEVHDSASDAEELYSFDNAQMDTAGIPNAFIRTCDSTDVSASDTIAAIEPQSLQNSMAIVKQMVFYVSAVTDKATTFDSSAIKQVKVSEINKTLSEYDTEHFQLIWEPQFDMAIPDLVPMLDQLWDEDEWWNYSPSIGKKIRIYLVTSTDEGWATAHRSVSSANESGIQSPGNYSVSVIEPNGDADANSVIGCIAHEFNHDAATYNLMKVYHNVTSFKTGNMVAQTTCDYNNQECSGHLTPLLFSPGRNGTSWVTQSYSTITGLFQASSDSGIDWSSYKGDAFQKISEAQCVPHYDQLGSLYTYIWENYGPDVAREICYAMYSDSRNLQAIVQNELGVPFQQIEDGWFAWMKSSIDNPTSSHPTGLHTFDTDFEYEFSKTIQLPSKDTISITDPQGHQIPIDNIYLSEPDSSGLFVKFGSLQKDILYSVVIQPDAIHYASGGSADPKGIKFILSVS
jgi:hypothetical protein